MEFEISLEGRVGDLKAGHSIKVSVYEIQLGSVRGTEAVQRIVSQHKEVKCYLKMLDTYR